MDIRKELGLDLSPSASLFLPEDAGFESTGKRWNCRYPLTFSAIVDAASEEDVSATIKYANAHNIPFLAFNGTHGAQLPLLKFKDGIGITTLKMRGLAINSEDGGKTAWIRGSWLSGDLRNELYKLRKRAVHGSCDSTGIIGPMLGGGHGLLQGRYGLLADQIVEMRVVLADGTSITVSEESNGELFWAMRGAGHNFGVVTSVRYKVYDVPDEDEWTQSEIVFEGGKLGELVPIFNKMVESQPVELAIWFPQIMRRPDLDPSNPVIMVQTLYEGSASSNPFLELLQALKPVKFESKIVSWPSTSDAIGWGWSSFSNKKGLVNVLRFPIGLKSFNYAAMKDVYDHYAAITAAQPAFAYSFVVWESYSTQAVKAVPDEATAVADRDDNMLVAPIVIYPPNSESDDEAAKFGKKLRAFLLKGSGNEKELHAYINYAHGDESVEEVYGHQKWRLEKLRRLKKQYDPANRFGFYSPIV